jgi:hypothetical protein
MKIIKIEFLIQNGSFQKSSEFENILDEIKKAIVSVTHPKGSHQFSLYPQKRANGVVPIKKNFLDFLVQNEWRREH